MSSFLGTVPLPSTFHAVFGPCMAQEAANVVLGRGAFNYRRRGAFRSSNDLASNDLAKRDLSRSPNPPVLRIQPPNRLQILLCGDQTRSTFHPVRLSQ